MQQLAAGVRQIDASGRRWYTSEFKQGIVAACRAPGASISRIAVEHGLNPNLVRKWLDKAAGVGSTDNVTRLLPVIAAQSPEPSAESESVEASRFVIEVQLASGAVILVSEHARAEMVRAVIQSLR